MHRASASRVIRDCARVRRQPHLRHRRRRARKLSGAARGPHRAARAGVPGEVTAQALERLPGLLDEHSPKLVLLCIGGNDFLRRLGRTQAEENVRAMVKLARTRGVDVLLIRTPEPGLQIAAPEFYGAIAEDFGPIPTRPATASSPSAWPSG